LLRKRGRSTDDGSKPSFAEASSCVPQPRGYGGTSRRAGAERGTFGDGGN